MWISNNKRSLARAMAAFLLAIAAASLIGCDRPSGRPETLTPPLLLQIQLSPNTVQVAKGTHFQLTAMGIYQDRSTRDITSQVSWHSLDGNLLQSLGKGQFAALQPGQTQVTARLGVLSADAGITITNASLTRLEISPVTINLAQGNQTKLQAIGIFSDGTKQTLNTQVNWQIEPASLADLISDDALQAQQPGTGELRAVYTGEPGITASVPLAIRLASLQSISLTAEPTQLALGTRSRLQATGVYDDGQVQDLSTQVEWRLSDPALGEVVNDENGVWLLPRQAGSVQLSARLDGQESATLNLTISAARLQSLELVAERKQLARGQTTTLRAIGVLSDGSRRDFTQSVVWSSKNPRVAAVDTTTGIVSAVAPGGTEIVALHGNIVATLPVEVTQAVLSDLLLAADTLSLPVGHELFLTATGVYSDGSRMDLSNRVTWLVDEPSVLTLDNGGQAGRLVALQEGSAEVTAVMGERQATLTFQVVAAQLTSLIIEPQTTALPAGSSQPLRLIGVYSDNAKRAITTNVLWASSAENIARIEQAGQVSVLTALAPGSTQISAQVGTLSTRLDIEVTPAVLTAIEIELPRDTHGGTLLPVAAMGIYQDGRRSDISARVDWQLPDGGTIIKDEDGQYYFSPPGGRASARLNASLDGVDASTSVTLGTISLVRLSIEPMPLQLAAGGSEQLRVIGIYSDGSRQDLTAQALWQVADPGLAHVNTAGQAPGRLFALQAGTTTLSAEYQGYRAEATLQVSAAILQRLEIQPPLQPWLENSSQQLTAIGVYSDDSLRDLSEQVNWSSEDPAVVTVANNQGQAGLATAQSPGTTRISAVLGTVEGSIDVTIEQQQLSRLEITPSNPAVAKGTRLSFSVTGIYDNNAKQDLTEQVQWSIADTAIVAADTPSPSLTQLRAQSEGQTNLTVSLGNIQASSTITVTPATLIALDLQQGNEFIAVGTSTRLAAVASFSDSSQQTVTQQVAWSSADESIATVVASGDDAGRVFGLKAGTTNITASWQNVNATFVITVSDASLQQLNIEPASSVLTPGTRLPLQATGVFSDGNSQDLTDQVLWISENSNLAAVGNASANAGVVTALAASDNPVRISARFNDIEASSFITVTDSLLQTITIEPTLGSLPYGFVAQLRAIAQFADGSTQDITQAATWSIDTGGESLASIENTLDNSGLLRTLSPGTITVRARFNGIEAAQTVQIENNPLAPVALAMVARPNVILNNGEEQTEIIIYTRAADPSQTIADGSVIDLDIVSGEGLLSTTQVTTVNGQASFRLSSNYTGIVTVRARIADSLVGNIISIYATDALNKVLGRWVLADPIIDSGQLLTGSRFGLIIANFSNRTFGISAFGVANSERNLEGITDPAYLSDGDLLPGEATALLYITEQDSSDPIIDLGYLLTDQLSGQEFTAAVRIEINLNPAPP